MKGELEKRIREAIEEYIISTTDETCVIVQPEKFWQFLAEAKADFPLDVLRVGITRDAWNVGWDSDKIEEWFEKWFGKVTSKSTH